MWAIFTAQDVFFCQDGDRKRAETMICKCSEKTQEM